MLYLSGRLSVSYKSIRNLNSTDKCNTDVTHIYHPSGKSLHGLPWRKHGLKLAMSQLIPPSYRVPRGLKGHTRAEGLVVDYHYNAAGRKVATIDPLGHWRHALGQPVSIEGPENQRWQITRNYLGHPLDVTGPEGNTI